MSMIYFVLVDEAFENKVMETENLKISGKSLISYSQIGGGYTRLKAILEAQFKSVNFW